jgi:hypothetical protein
MNALAASLTHSRGNTRLFYSVTDPNPDFSIPDPGSRVYKIPEPHHQRISVFSTQKLFLSSRKYDPGCPSMIRIFFHPGSRIQGSKKHRIPDAEQWFSRYLDWCLFSLAGFVAKQQGCHRSHSNVTINTKKIEKEKLFFCVFLPSLLEVLSVGPFLPLSVPLYS